MGIPKEVGLTSGNSRYLNSTLYTRNGYPLKIDLGKGKAYHSNKRNKLEKELLHFPIFCSEVDEISELESQTKLASTG